MAIKSTSDRSLAVFIDFENLALGFIGRNDRFDIRIVLKRLLEKGKIVAKKAYADWNRFGSYTGSLHEAAIELIEIPRRGQSGKNSADIRLCVDAMDLAYSKEHIDTFVIVSGDSDFSPLVSKLKELGKHVIGLGMSTSTSNLLRDNCDEFIYYEDLTRDVAIDQVIKVELPDTKRKVFMLLLNAMTALRRDNKEILHPSQIKATMQRMKPSFNETYHGYRTFSLLLEDAQREGLLLLDTDKRSGTYVVTHFGEELDAAPPKKPSSPTAVAATSDSVGIPAGEQAIDESHSPAQTEGEIVPSPKPSRGRRRRGGRGRRRGGPEGGPGIEGTHPIVSTSETASGDSAPIANQAVEDQSPQETPPPMLTQNDHTDHLVPTDVPSTVETSGTEENAESTTETAQKKRRSRGGRGRGGRGRGKPKDAPPTSGDGSES
jgi:uncharacterized protein (TIGR00288 family)